MALYPINPFNIIVGAFIGLFVYYWISRIKGRKMDSVEMMISAILGFIALEIIFYALWIY